jgi:hypothetical protein
MQALLAVLSKFQMNPVEVFRNAFHYAEIRKSNKRMKLCFVNSCVQVDGKYILDCVPEFVQDYCLDLLTGRTQPPKERKLITNERKA